MFVTKFCYKIFIQSIIANYFYICSCNFYGCNFLPICQTFCLAINVFWCSKYSMFVYCVFCESFSNQCFSNNHNFVHVS